MYREIVVRVFGEEAVNKVDNLRKAGIDFTDLVYAAIMTYEINSQASQSKQVVANY